MTISSLPLAARLELVAETDAHEGPVYVEDENALYFTTVPRPEVAIKRLALDTGEISVVRENANNANGMTLDAQGRLVICEQGTFDARARISRLDRRTGAVETLVDRVDGLPLNSPNDVVVRSDGTIWFTDPSYGFLQGFRPQPRVPDRVYRYDPASETVSAVADALDKPNGLAFSPDETVLYVADNGAPHHLLAVHVRTGERRVFAASTPEHPDGVKVDTEGRVYATASHGVLIFGPDGEQIGEIELPGAVNFTFGGADGDVLFITADTAIWAATPNPKGA